MRNRTRGERGERLSIYTNWTVRNARWMLLLKPFCRCAVHLYSDEIFS